MDELYNLQADLFEKQNRIGDPAQVPMKRKWRLMDS